MTDKNLRNRISFRQKVLYLNDYNSERALPTQGPKLAWSEYKDRTNWKFEPFLPVGH